MSYKTNTNQNADIAEDIVKLEIKRCDEPFDKKSKDHAMTWRVVVRENPTRISLFCPQCIEKTKEVLDAHANTTD